MKEALILADRLKAGPFDPDSFRAAVTKARADLAALTAIQIDQIVRDRDQQRLLRFDDAKWVVDEVDLDRISVWPGMGRRGWAKGPVGKVAEEFRKRNDQTDRIWEIVKIVEVIRADLLLILLRGRSDLSLFRTEEGCHRAVAYYLAGLRRTLAYVGTVKDEINLNWRWEG